MHRVVIVALFTAATAVAQETPHPPTPAEIAKLIEQLSDKQFRERERAGQKLLELDDIPPALEAALRSPSPETARRAARIVEQIQTRNRERQFQRELGRVNRIGVDFFLNRMVLDRDFATADRWKFVADLADVLVQSANELGYAGCAIPKARWTELPLVTDSIRRTERLARVAIEGQNVRGSVSDCLVICAGPMTQMLTIRNSILFIDGDFDGARSVQNSVIVCTGSVGSINIVNGSMILTPGRVGTVMTLRNSFIHASKIAAAHTAEGNTFINLTQLEGADETNRFVSSEKSPRSLMQWFDLARLGLKLTHIDGEARVDSLVEGKPFAKSGLKPGDMIQLIDGRGWVDADHFGRELRNRLVRDSMEIRLRRGGKIEDVTIRLQIKE